MYSDTEWRKCMDNKGNQNKNGKNPRGQNYAVLMMTMLFTLLCVAMMHNLWQGSRTHKMPYSEFNQMLKDHEAMERFRSRRRKIRRNMAAARENMEIW